MSARKVTAWYPPEVRPVREGFYQSHALGVDHAWMAYWDKDRWLTGKGESECAYQYRAWRGLARKPK